MKRISEDSLKWLHIDAGRITLGNKEHEFQLDESFEDCRCSELLQKVQGLEKEKKELLTSLSKLTQEVEELEKKLLKQMDDNMALVQKCMGYKEQLKHSLTYRSALEEIEKGLLNPSWVCTIQQKLYSKIPLLNALNGKKADKHPLSVNEAVCECGDKRSLDTFCNGQWYCSNCELPDNPIKEE